MKLLKIGAVLVIMDMVGLAAIGHRKHVPTPQPVTRCRGAVEIWYKGEWVTLPITCKIPEDWAK